MYFPSTMQPYYNNMSSVNVTPYFSNFLASAQTQLPPPVTAFSHADVVGEGDIATILFQDGSIRFFFIPYGNPSHIQPFNPYTPTYRHPYWLTSSGVWFIRSVSNPIPLFSFNQLLQEMYAFSHPEPPCFSHNNDVNKAAYKLKFHNHAETSTTDLSWFCCFKCNCVGQPQQLAHPSFFLQPQTGAQTPVLTGPTSTIKYSESVQVNLPVVEAMSTGEPEVASKRNESFVSKPQKMDTATMPVDDLENESLTDSKVRKKKNCKCVRSKTSNKSSTTYVDDLENDSVTDSKVRKKKNCKCVRSKTSNKSSTTYNTQSTNCQERKNTKTQTSVEKAIHTEAEPRQMEIWTAVTPQNSPIPEFSGNYRMDTKPEKSPFKSLSRLTMKDNKKDLPTNKQSNRESVIWTVTTLDNSRILALESQDRWCVTASAPSKRSQGEHSETHEVWTRKCVNRDLPEKTELWTHVSSHLDMETESSTCIDLCESDSTNYSKTSVE